MSTTAADLLVLVVAALLTAGTFAWWNLHARSLLSRWASFVGMILSVGLACAALIRLAAEVWT